MSIHQCPFISVHLSVSIHQCPFISVHSSVSIHQCPFISVYTRMEKAGKIMPGKWERIRCKKFKHKERFPLTWDIVRKLSRIWGNRSWILQPSLFKWFLVRSNTNLYFLCNRLFALSENGGHQEESPEHEGGEGQPVWQDGRGGTGTVRESQRDIVRVDTGNRPKITNIFLNLA